MIRQQLADDRAHGHVRIQRGIRILKDHLHLRAQGAQLLFAQRCNIRSLQKDFAGGRLVKAYNRARERGFAASGFAHETKAFAFKNIQRNMVYRLDVLHRTPEHTVRKGTFDREPLADILHLDELGCLGVIKLCFRHTYPPPLRLMRHR